MITDILLLIRDTVMGLITLAITIMLSVALTIVVIWSLLRAPFSSLRMGLSARTWARIGDTLLIVVCTVVILVFCHDLGQAVWERFFG